MSTIAFQIRLYALGWRQRSWMLKCVFDDCAHAGLYGKLVIEPLNGPDVVVDVAESKQREPEFFDDVEGLDPQQVLLERLDELSAQP